MKSFAKPITKVSNHNRLRLQQWVKCYWTIMLDAALRSMPFNSSLHTRAQRGLYVRKARTEMGVKGAEY